MKTPAEVRTTAARRFRASCRRWLAGHLGLPDDSAWPFAVPLGVPSESEVLADPQKTLDWRDAWSAEAESGRLKVAFAVRDWTACGRQTVPERAVFESPEAVARAAGELHTWRRALERASRLVDGEDGLREAVVRAWSVLAEWEDEGMGGRGFRDSALRLQVACRQSRKRSLCSSAARRGHGYQVAHEAQNDGASRSSRRPLACFREARARGAGLRGLRRSEEQALERAHEAS